MPAAKLNETDAARVLSALGSPVRLRVYKALLRAGPEGTNLTELQRALGMPATTLTHHLAKLLEAGIVGQEKRGRELISSASFKRIRAVSGYLLAECCADARSRSCRAA